MKETVLKRAMFAAPISKKTMNSGIMAGFEDEDMMEEASAEESPPMARTPQNPEILMNNLRGDIRSIDARYLELAQMVGEEAAMDTPPEVLAMLQGQMGAQAAPSSPPAGGIGALPQAPQMPPEGMMPPGMEGAGPFPQGGAEQAPPTPDGMPPLRAADGMFATQGNRFAQAQQNLQGDMDRMLALANGTIPPEQMTERDMQLLQQYNASMGFAGGLRDVTRQGMGRISSALDPYVTRGREMLSNLPVPSFQGFRVAPMRGADQGRMVVQGRENIVAGSGGMPASGTGTKFEGANTLEVGNIPFTQAFRESMRVNPRSTLAAGTVGGGTAASMLANMRGANLSNVPPEELEAAVARVNQIPNEFQERSQQFPLTPPTPPGQESPALATINVARNEPMVDLSTPFDSLGQAGKGKQVTGGFMAGRPRPLSIVDTMLTGGAGGPPSKDEITEAIKDLQKKETPPKTYGTRLKERFAEIEPTFSEMLGDTKSDLRANALFLLADAGFKLASTYAPTTAMAIGEAFSGVPRGLAALTAQAKDRGIKIRTAALSEAAQSIQLEDKYAKDIQRAILEQQSRAAIALFNAKSRAEIEAIKQDFGLRKAFIEGDIQTNLELIRQNPGKIISQDVGVGMLQQNTKSGDFVGFALDPNALKPEGVLGQMLNSPYTNNSTTSPFVESRGKSPFTASQDKTTRLKLQNQVGSIDSSLQQLDQLRGQYVEAYSPGTWVVDKFNNIIVPVSFGTLKPDLKQDQAVSNLRLTVQQLEKAMAAANDDGRLAIQEQEWVKALLEDINRPAAFFQNQERAAKQFAVLETILRNKRQEALMKLIPGLPNEVMTVPATGTQNDPFVLTNDVNQRQKMFRYLAETIGKSQAPNAIVHLRTPEGNVIFASPEQLRKLVQR